MVAGDEKMEEQRGQDICSLPAWQQPVVGDAPLAKATGTAFPSVSSTSFLPPPLQVQAGNRTASTAARVHNCPLFIALKAAQTFVNTPLI